jgi:hypothetical protein
MNAMSIDAEVFTDEQDAVHHVFRFLCPSVPEPFAHALASHFVLYCDGTYNADDWPLDRAPYQRIAIGAPLDFLEGPWTIKEAELRELKEVLIAAIGSGLEFTKPGHGYGSIAFVLSAVLMLRRLRRKSVSVGPLQRRVLFGLRKRGPMALSTLVDDVNRQGLEWSTADVQEALDELGKVRLNDGTTVALVHHAGDGLWSTDARGLWELPRGSSEGMDL